jgi:hypothetical protein
MPIGPVPAAELAQVQGRPPRPAPRTPDHLRAATRACPPAAATADHAADKGNSAAQTMISNTGPAPRQARRLCDRLKHAVQLVTRTHSSAAMKYVETAQLMLARLEKEAARGGADRHKRSRLPACYCSAPDPERGSVVDSLAGSARSAAVLHSWPAGSVVLESRAELDDLRPGSGRVPSTIVGASVIRGVPGSSQGSSGLSCRRRMTGVPGRRWRPFQLAMAMCLCTVAGSSSSARMHAARSARETLNPCGRFWSTAVR